MACCARLTRPRCKWHNALLLLQQCTHALAMRCNGDVLYVVLNCDIVTFFLSLHLSYRALYTAVKKIC